jgi:hypothetical protein
LLERENNFPLEEENNLREEIAEINRSEFNAGLEELRDYWVEKINDGIRQVNHIDNQHSKIDRAFQNNQTINFFCQKTFDDEGNLVSRLYYFRARPKGNLGFDTNIPQEG